MSKIEDYRTQLRILQDWEPFLLAESGLPGPRGNIELAQAAADVGDADQFWHWLEFTADKAPVNSPYEFLAFCGAIGLGRLAAEGNSEALITLRRCASDERWRMREAVAMAMQRVGEADMAALLAAIQPWSRGNAYEQRAAAAAICEPRLLHEPHDARAALDLLDSITESLAGTEIRTGDDFAALKKGLAYCWSVAVAALPEVGKTTMQKWLASSDKDVRWIMRENLKKNRLIKMDPVWVDSMRISLG